MHIFSMFLSSKAHIEIALEYSTQYFSILVGTSISVPDISTIVRVLDEFSFPAVEQPAKRDTLANIARHNKAEIILFIL